MGNLHGLLSVKVRRFKMLRSKLSESSGIDAVGLLGLVQGLVDLPTALFVFPGASAQNLSLLTVHFCSVTCQIH